MINIPASFSDAGKRERRYFSTREAAKRESARLREQALRFGEAAATIRPSLAEAAEQAEEILQPWGIGLVEAARIVAQQQERNRASKRLDEAVQRWLETCEELRDRTYAGYRQTGNKLEKEFGGRLLSTLSTAELQSLLLPPGNVGASARGNYRNARAFWRWSAKNGWCDTEVFNQIQLPRSKRDTPEISILTPDEARNLLETAERHYPRAVARYAIQLFAGVRPEELRRLKPNHVRPDAIELPAAVTKKGRRRHIAPHPTLAAWLEAYPFSDLGNWREIDKACRCLAGWDVKSRLLEDHPRPTRGPWPQNVLRHSHASYAVAIGASLETLLFEFGHTGTAAVLREHYVGRASRKDAIRFFRIGPEGKQLPVMGAA